MASLFFHFKIYQMIFKSYSTIRFLCIAVALFLVSSSMLFAQESNKIIILDTETQQPISDVSFVYDNQKGISNKNGFIEFSYRQDVEMQLSHISYGIWVLNESGVICAIENGTINKRIKQVNLFPVTVIALHTFAFEKEMIALDYNDRLSHDGGDVLSKIPAISGIRKSANYGFDPVLRGFKYEQINIVMNGAQSAIAACPNRMDPPTSQMAPNMMGKVEVYKGPHALRFGNAFGGTINFVAAKPEFSTKQKVYGRISGGYESNGNILRTEGMVGIKSKRYDLGVFGSISQGGNYTDGDANEVLARFARSSFGANLGVKITEKQHITLSAHRNFANDVDFVALPMDLREDDTWMLNAGHEINIAGHSLTKWKTMVYGTFVDHFMDNRLKELEPRLINAQTDAKTKMLGARTEGYWKFEKQNLYLGADFKSENAKGEREREFLMGPNAGNIIIDKAWQNGTINKTALFAEYQLSKGSLSFVISGRVELNQSSITDADADFETMYVNTDATQLNPAISFGVVKELNSKYNIGLWLGRGQRSGSLTERFINYFSVGNDPYEMLGNPELKPEANNQIDATLEYKSNRARLNFDVFVAYLQNYISSEIDTNLSPNIPISPGVRRFTNIDNAFKTGFEFNWNQELFLNLYHNFYVAYTYAQNLYLSEPLAEIAPMDLRYSLYGKLLKNKLKPELRARYVLKQNRVSDEFGEKESADFGVLDFHISYKVIKILNLTAGVNNIFDKAYYEHLNRAVKSKSPAPINAPGRSYFISLSLSFM